MSLLKGIEELNMRYCDQDNITDAAFQHLKGIKVLHMYGCRTVCKQAARDVGLFVRDQSSASGAFPPPPPLAL